MLDYLESLFSRAYLFEHESNEKIFSSLSFPTSVIIVVLGAIFYFTNALLPVDQTETVKIIALFTLLASLACVICASYQVWNAAHGNDYKYIDYDKLRDYANGLEEYYAEIGSDHASELAKSDIQRHLISQFAEGASFNAEVNEKRLWRRINAFKWTGGSIIFLMATAVLSAQWVP